MHYILKRAVVYGKKSEMVDFNVPTEIASLRAEQVEAIIAEETHPIRHAIMEQIAAAGDIPITAVVKHSRFSEVNPMVNVKGLPHTGKMLMCNSPAWVVCWEQKAA